MTKYKRFFREDDQYVDVAHDFDRDVRNALKVVVEKWKGYSLRDMEYLMIKEASMLCCERILCDRFNKEKK